MNILYCGDAYIASGVVLSVLSLAQRVPEPLHVYLLTVEYRENGCNCRPLSEGFARRLEQAARRYAPETRVTLFNITDLFRAEPPLANLGTRFTPCCMLRLYADLVPGLPDRILYLDNDVLCRRDCTALWRTPGDFELAGVPDFYGRWIYHRHPLDWQYLNSGVLLLNLAAIRKSGLFARCRTLCAEKKMFLPDQAALNKLARRRKALPRRFNEQRKQRSGTVLRHFTTTFRLFPYFHSVTVKPWQPERMHGVLKLHEYDALLAQYSVLKEELFHDDF